MKNYLAIFIFLLCAIVPAEAGAVVENFPLIEKDGLEDFILNGLIEILPPACVAVIEVINRTGEIEIIEIPCVDNPTDRQVRWEM